MRINIVQLIQDSYFPYICGNSTVAYVFSKLIKDLEINQYIIVDNKDEKEGLLYEVDNIPVYNANGNEDAVSNYIRKFVSEYNINVVIMHDAGYPKFMNYIKTAEVAKILVSHFYDQNILEYEQYFNLIISFQHYDIKRYIELGVDKQKLEYVPHYPYLMFNTGTEYKKNSFIYLGRVNEHKQPHLLFPYLKTFDATYTIMGPVDDNYYSFLIEKINEYDIADRVTFVKKTNNRHLIREILNNHEFFFQGSKKECFSLSLLEAMACGLKCIVNYSDPSSGYDWCNGLVYFFYDKDGNDIREAISRAMISSADKKTISDYTNHYYNKDAAMSALYRAIMNAIKLNAKRTFKTGSMKYKEMLVC